MRAKCEGHSQWLVLHEYEAPRRRHTTGAPHHTDWSAAMHDSQLVPHVHPGRHRVRGTAMSRAAASHAVGAAAAARAPAFASVLRKGGKPTTTAPPPLAPLEHVPAPGHPTSHSAYFDSLLSLIPTRYFQQLVDTDDGADHAGARYFKVRPPRAGARRLCAHRAGAEAVGAHARTRALTAPAVAASMLSER